ncbi:hypothetical protein BN7_481 [Wickerhamomyces ciferrii]|uniref:FAM192A/Fyv6 N-terminal domain-containing protein n=1 Tax=Wickerhamomyces ciferrii (strain ATCC 14091 / BCRC 22168 / CBS 111 / JCM 3599 / NBRC 0793 / NRRL Y-1031 F-60-10) TaxID=1206466 RepID=K0KFE4_WICCF|nr:uncharacterized protein BN7_481 [Wickerhamomyces ciferrii]CCH40947.1 hypothetical protein BN7_481 [Wickerhamomyces ciferrii]
MSRFIPEGKSDLKSLQKSENEAANKFATEKEAEETPSLYDQMKANYIAKEKAYEDKVKAKNQSHKIDARELEFYNQLQREKEAKEMERKRQLDEELEEFTK